MFSGIVAELGQVAANRIGEQGRLEITAGQVLDGVRVGDSIAVNGCCLTVVESDRAGFVADVMPETARRTTLGSLSAGDPVNLEAAMALGDRVGGHLVSGHVDATGRVRSVRDEGNARWVRISPPSALLPYLVEKGSVAVDGISLTVVEVDTGAFSVSLIPHTLAVTVAGSWEVGSLVNLEVDVVARYVVRNLHAYTDAATAALGSR
ncbi:MAG: riboflavin synthase [Candidatus Dormibacteria bacterium]